MAIFAFKQIHIASLSNTAGKLYLSITAKQRFTSKIKQATSFQNIVRMVENENAITASGICSTKSKRRQPAL